MSEWLGEMGTKGNTADYVSVREMVYRKNKKQQQ